MVTMAANVFTAQEVRDLELVYGVFDTLNRGYLQQEDLRKALRVLGFKVSRAAVQQLISDIGDVKGTSRGQSVSFESFLQMVSKLQGSSYDKHGEIVQAFAYIDCDSDGAISLEDLKAASRAVGLGLSEGELRGMVEEGDRRGDGRIDRQEFIELMMKTNLFR